MKNTQNYDLYKMTEEEFDEKIKTLLENEDEEKSAEDKYLLSLAYLNGKFAKKDEVKGAKYLKESADEKCIKAVIELLDLRNNELDKRENGEDDKPRLFDVSNSDVVNYALQVFNYFSENCTTEEFSSEKLHDICNIIIQGEMFLALNNQVKTASEITFSLIMTLERRENLTLDLKRDKARLLFRYANLCLMFNDIKLAYEYNDKALKIVNEFPEFDDVDTLVLYFSILSTKSNLLYVASDCEQAGQLIAEQVEEKFSKIKNKETKLFVEPNYYAIYLCLASSYFNIGKFQKGADYASDCISKLEKCTSQKEICVEFRVQAYSVLASCLYKLEREEESISNFETAIEILENESTDSLMSKYFKILKISTDLANVYLFTKRDTLAKKVYLQNIKIIKKCNYWLSESDELLFINTDHLSRIYCSEGNYEKAVKILLEYTNPCDAWYLRVNAYDNYVEALVRIREIYKEMGDKENIDFYEFKIKDILGSGVSFNDESRVRNLVSSGVNLTDRNC